MILDTLDQLSRYYLPYKEEIIQYLRDHDPLNVPDGEHEIKGRYLFVRVMSHEPKPADENKFETHREYADLQFVAEGVELMQVAFPDQLRHTTQYDAAGDYQFFEIRGGFVTDLVVRKNEFAIFYPGEAHRPACLYKNNKSKVKKLVFKIKFNP